MAVNYDGFAQGFQGGFGLMQDAIANQRRNELEKERLEETKRQNNLSYDLKTRQLGIEQQLADVRKLVGTAQAGNLDAETAEIPADSQSRRRLQGSQADNLDAETAEIPADSQARRRLQGSQADNLDAETAEIPADSKSKRELQGAQAGKLEAETAEIPADAESRRKLQSSQAGNLDATAESTRQDTEIAVRTDAQVRGAEALQLMMGTAQDVINGDATPEQFAQLLEMNKDTITAAGFVFDPSFDITLANFQKDLANGNFAGSSGVDLLNAVARSSNKFNIGAMVDETFVNAPPEFRNGGFRVVSSEFIDFREVEGGITGTILNVVEDANGNQFMYTSPNTAGRNTSDGTPLVLPVDDLMASLSAVTQMRGQMGGLKAQMKEAAQIARYGKGEQGQNDFMADVQEERDRYSQIAIDDPTRRSPIPNMTMQEFVDNPTVMTDYIENGILFDYENETYGRETYDMLMEATRNSEDARIIGNRLGGHPLTPKELESIQIIQEGMPRSQRIKLRESIYRRLQRNRMESGARVGQPNTVKGRPTQ